MRIEQETIINFNDEEDLATLWTASPTVRRRMDKMLKNPLISKTKNGIDFAEYTFPSSCVKIKMPLSLSDEKRAELAKRAALMRGKKNGSANE